MNRGDKVVCVDDSRRPHKSPPDWKLEDFSFPGGFVSKDSIYCVEEAFPRADGTLGLRIVGKPILYRYWEVEWSSLRFRKVEPRSETVVEAREEPTPASL